VFLRPTLVGMSFVGHGICSVLLQYNIFHPIQFRARRRRSVSAP
jgi:hypothetical protein